MRMKIIERRVETMYFSIIFGHNETFEILEDVTKNTVVDLLRNKCDCSAFLDFPANMPSVA